MKVGDLVQHKRKGWIAVVLEINELNKSADIVWSCTSSPRQPPFDNVSMSRFRVINESR